MVPRFCFHKTDEHKFPHIMMVILMMIIMIVIMIMIPPGVALPYLKVSTKPYVYVEIYSLAHFWSSFPYD